MHLLALLLALLTTPALPPAEHVGRAPGFAPHVVAVALRADPSEVDSPRQAEGEPADHTPAERGHPSSGRRGMFLKPGADAMPPLRTNMEAAADYSESCSGRAVLVLHNGRVVFERYALGWTPDQPHPLASGTKSFAGLVAAAALHDGLIHDLDERVSDTLTEWRSDVRKKDVTVRQLLELSSGLEPNHESLGRAGAGIKGLGPQNDLADRLRERRGLNKPDDRFAAATNDVPMTSSRPGETFRYGPSHFYAFGAYLERKLAQRDAVDRPGVKPRTYFAYMHERVLVPAGLSDVKLDRFAPDAADKPNLPGGGHLTAREWARFGEFVRLGGVTKVPGEHTDQVRPPLVPPSASPTLDDPDAQPVSVIDASMIDMCFSPSRANPTYGLTWWLLTGEPGAVADVGDDGPAPRRRAVRQAGQTERIVDEQGRPIPVAMAAGAGKQRLYILPTVGLVVVRFAEMNTRGAAYSDTAFLQKLLGAAY